MIRIECSLENELKETSQKPAIEGELLGVYLEY